MPAATSTVSPGCAKVEACWIVAQGREDVQGLESLPAVDKYKVPALKGTEALARRLTATGRTD